jgi:hypothetical protein
MFHIRYDKVKKKHHYLLGLPQYNVGKAELVLLYLGCLNKISEVEAKHRYIFYAGYLTH